MAVFNKTIIPRALVGYEMIIANSALPGIIVNYKVKTIALKVQANGMLFS